MPEFIVSWSAYGPSGRLTADTLELATRYVEEHLWALGLETKVQSGQGDGHFVVIKSPVKRYGDMASFGICVYEVGQTSFYDLQREALDHKHKQQEAYDAEASIEHL